MLLLGIFLIYNSYREEKPLLFVAVDQSESMLNYADSVLVKKQLPEYLKQVEANFGEQYKIKTISFGEQVSDSISFDFNQKKTNIGAVFDQIHEKYIRRNIGAILLLSDGNYNEGIYPTYSAKQLNFVPIFSIGIGDTVPKKDLAIQSVFANEIAFSSAIFPIEIEGNAMGFKEKSATLELYQNGSLIDSKTIQLPSSDNNTFSHKFEVKANGKGYQRFTVKIQSNEKEYTLTNNSKTIYVEIIDERNKILLISNSINPDIGAIRSVLEKNKNMKTEVKLAHNIKKLPQCDLVIYYNPTAPYKPEIWNEINRLKKSVLIVLGSDLKNSGLSQLNIGVSNVMGNKTDRVQARFNTSFPLIHFSDELKVKIADFPPLKVAFAGNWTNIGDVLLYQQMNGVVLQRSLVGLNRIGEQKTAVIYGQGLWRWRLSEQKQYGNTKVFDELISKLVQYLSVKQNTSKLRVYPPKNASNQDEIIFRAEFYNDAFQLITEPEIKLIIYDENKKTISSSVLYKSTNDYSLNLGRLHSGKYSWEASTNFGNKKYKKSGEFIVRDISMETLSLNANFNILNELSVSSKGKFYTFNKRKEAIKELKKRKEISTVRFEETAFNELIDYKILFFIVILLLSLEWAIKRWLGAY